MHEFDVSTIDDHKKRLNELIRIPFDLKTDTTPNAGRPACRTSKNLLRPLYTTTLAIIIIVLTVDVRVIVYIHIYINLY